MSIFSRLCLAVALSLSASLAAAQAGAPAAAPEPSNVQEQQKRQATQPGNNAPVWRDVRSGQENFTTIKGRETGVLIQSGGDTWRRVRNGPVTFYGGLLVVLIAAAILAFYSIFGAVKLHDKPTGRLIERFSRLDQIVHWSVAISFCILGLGGLIMLFGKHVLLPVIGYTLFGWLTALSKNLHNFVAPIFIVSVAAMIVLYLRHNLPKAYDIKFLLNAFAVMAKGKHVPSGKFNGGEKVWFWGGVVVLSIVVTWSGLILLFPNFDQTRAVMQEAWVWHACAALLYISISFGHMYLGTIGLEGSYQAMRTGYVDETWAKEHHQYWYEEMKSKSAAHPARGGAVPAGAPHMKETP
ncbi:MAG TPA: formate dehydrogenase subunit gamma [Burkholderiales bacterium]|jgi:formate dehydrogenase subunit gamma